MRSPRGPFAMPRRSIWAAAKRSPVSFGRHGMADSAAALTYYGVFSIFPALLVLVSVLSFFGPGATDPLLESIDEAPPEAADLLRAAVNTAARGTSEPVFAIGLIVALWGASGYVGAFGRASNRAFSVQEGRPFVSRRPQELLLTALVLLLVVFATIAAVLSGPVAREFAELTGIDPRHARSWDTFKLPGILIVCWLAILILMAGTPNVRLKGLRWVVPGASVALVGWAASTAVLSIYFARLAGFEQTYGALASVIASLFWLWVSNLVLLFGQVLNAELEYERQRLAGETAEDGSFAVRPRRAPRTD